MWGRQFGYFPETYPPPGKLDPVDLAQLRLEFGDLQSKIQECPNLRTVAAWQCSRDRNVFS